MKEAYSKIDAKELTNGYLAFYQNQSAQNSSFNFEAQFSAFSFSNLTGAFSNSSKTANEISNILSGIDFKSVGYEGKPINELSREEASDLVSENGFFGIANTADRMSGFVINLSFWLLPHFYLAVASILSFGIRQLEKPSLKSPSPLRFSFPAVLLEAL